MANTRLRPEPLYEKQTFRGIDLIKFLCAILVVSIHAAPFGQTGITLNRLLNFGTQHYLARLAVPFFFMCTGFLVFRKQPLEGFTFRTGAHAAWKMYRLYLIWTVIYIPLIINKYLPGGHVTLPALVGVIRNFLLTGSYVHLWYLNASGFVLLLVSFLLHKKVKIRSMLIVSFVLYLLGLLSQSYFGLMRVMERFPTFWKAAELFMWVIKTTRSGLFEGFFFVSLGIFIAKTPLRISLKQAVAGFVCSMALLLAEVVILLNIGWIREYDMYVFLVPAVFFLFCIAARLELKQRRVYLILRKLSALVYFVFMIARWFVDRLPVPGWAWFVRFWGVLVLSLLASALIIFLSERRPFKWLKKVYS